MKTKKDINVQIGLRIQSVRESADLTQAKLAELIGMGTKNISDIERGVVGISLSALKRVCEVLSVSSDILLFGNTRGNDTGDTADRLKNLPPNQREIALDIINKLFVAFALSGKNVS